jgi:hypothetical protein
VAEVAYDPVEVFYQLLSANVDWDSVGAKLIRAYQYKNIDLRTADYVVIGPATERDEFLGIGAMEFIRYVTIEVSVMTAESRERMRQLGEIVRRVIRTKEDWTVGDRLLLNVRISRQADRSDLERGLYTLTMEVEWFEIEKRVW